MSRIAVFCQYVAAIVIYAEIIVMSIGTHYYFPSDEYKNQKQRFEILAGNGLFVLIFLHLVAMAILRGILCYNNHGYERLDDSCSHRQKKEVNSLLVLGYVCLWFGFTAMSQILGSIYLRVFTNTWHFNILSFGVGAEIILVSVIVIAVIMSFLSFIRKFSAISHCVVKH